MNSSPDLEYRHAVLPADRAGTVTAARFQTDLRGQKTLPAEVSARLRAEAHAAGYAAGWAQGRREADVAATADRERYAAEAHAAAEAQASTVERAVRALAGAAQSLERRAVPAATDIEDTIVRAAFALAEAIVVRELATATEPGRDALARAMALAPAGRPVTVRLSPADHATLAVSTVDTDGRTVTVVADPGLAPGDAVAECDATTIEARLGDALDRVREVLGL